MIIKSNKFLNTKTKKKKKPLKSSLKSLIGSKSGIIRNLSKQNAVKFKKLILK